MSAVLQLHTFHTFRNVHTLLPSYCADSKDTQSMVLDCHASEDKKHLNTQKASVMKYLSVLCGNHITNTLQMLPPGLE